MIARLWHGRTLTTDAHEYREFVARTGMRDYLDTPGNLGAQIWQREEGDITHIWAVSWWRDYESIKAFAGEDFETARYYEDDEKYLLEFEPTVAHFEAFTFSRTYS